VADLADALRYLDEHINLEAIIAHRRVAPTLERMARLVAVMGDPQRDYPVIHITGTNGKGSTAQIITRLLMAQGLSVGTYTSPHLERLNERICRDGEPISDDDLAEQVLAIADLEVLAGVQPSWFEIVTAAAFRWFSDIAVDVAVIEVGLLGRWDATNVADAQVAVVTNVGADHLEYAGPTLAHVAHEKAGIVKPDTVLVLGETDPELVAIFRAAGAASVIERDEDFECTSNQLAFGGRVLDLRTPWAVHTELFLPLYGAHQGDNAAVALAAAEAFFDAPLSDDVVEEAFAAVRMPGRFEVLGHQPLVVIDGAHNPPGADACSVVLTDDFAPAGRLIMVVGLLSGREPTAMLAALRADEADVVICCTPPSPRALPARDVAAAARALGCPDVSVRDDVTAACDDALRGAEADDAVLVTGSLYVVGAARPHLVRYLA
jgi:dihydrofolate synthase/folylpolyglutamate synthase